VRRRWQRHTAVGGVRLASETTNWGPDPQPFVLASHATGFCKEVFRPVVDELRHRTSAATVLAFDHRAHGDSDVPPPPYDWWDLGRDVVGILDGRSGVVGVGHSAGAAALLLAELLAPGSFASLVLVEPIVFPGPYGRQEHSLVDAALKRKAEFTSRAAAVENWESKPAFSSWQPAALEAYARGGLAPEGAIWRLKCPPEAEAEFYRGSTAHGGWDRLGEIGSRITLIAGEHSDTHPGPFLERTAQQLGGGHVEVVAATSHFVVMERPDVIAEHIAAQMPAGVRQPHDDR
jgi:pimeloyl-ACP methyl ester carboxylesterase